MKKRIVALVLIDLFFILLLAISGIVASSWRLPLYFLAYILPLGLGILTLFRFDALSHEPRLACKADRAVFSAALFAPTMLAIIALSALTTLALSFFGKTNETDVSGSLIYELCRHALLPAVLEELLFRYLPIKLLLPCSKRGAVGVSALLFALIHLNLFQIPYALFAGVVLGFLTVASGSIIPAVLLHLLNNTVSVLWMRNPETVPQAIIALLLVLSIPSVVYIVRRRKEYKRAILSAFSGEAVGFSPELLAMTIICLFTSVLSF